MNNKRCEDGIRHCNDKSFDLNSSICQKCQDEGDQMLNDNSYMLDPSLTNEQKLDRFDEQVSLIENRVYGRAKIFLEAALIAAKTDQERMELLEMQNVLEDNISRLRSSIEIQRMTLCRDS